MQIQKKIIIVGLRATDPIPVGFGTDCLPGYFCEATSMNRRGFQLPGIDGWFVFATNPFAAKLFDHENIALSYISALIKHDKGRWRPLTMVTIYQ